MKSHASNAIIVTAALAPMPMPAPAPAEIPPPEDCLASSAALVGVAVDRLVGVEAVALLSEDAGVLCALADVVASDVPTVCEALAVLMLANTPTLSTFHHVGVFVASASLLSASFTSPVSGLT
jgi:hypothetical protein